MSELDNPLNRLFRAAAKSESGADPALPFGLASRVLGEWLAGGEETADRSFAIVCRRAVLCAYAVALLFLLFNLPALESFAGWNAWHGAEARLVDSTMQLQIP